MKSWRGRKELGSFQRYVQTLTISERSVKSFSSYRSEMNLMEKEKKKEKKRKKKQNNLDKHIKAFLWNP